ncbi:MAG: AMIN domain-containing protein [Gemmatimonadota bacterium]|nr:AMIN domain-containing protein [Gemmatimonadota bacterium]
MKSVQAVLIAAVIAVGPSTRLASARPAAEGVVTALSVIPASGKAEMVIGVGGSVKVSEFTLKSPDRVVIDIDGASLGFPPIPYDRAARGGVTDIRYSQFRKGTVRVVMYLDKERSYRVWRTVGLVHVAVETDSGAQFAAWKVGGNTTVTVASGPDRLAARLASSRPATDKAAPAPSKPAPSAPPTQSTAAAAEKPTPTVERPAPVKTAADAQATPTTLASNPADRAAPANRAENLDERPLHVTQQSQQRSQQPRITVTYQGSDIRDVLAAFAAFSGRTIIPSASVGAVKVDAEIRDQPWDVALQAILSSQGLAATEDANGIIIVDTQERVAMRMQTEPLMTRIVRLNYQRATAVASQIQQRLLQCIPPERQGASAPAAGQPPVAGPPPAQPTLGGGGSSTTTSSGQDVCRGRGSVSADEVTNSISVTAPVSVVDDLVLFAETLDLRQPQVNIKAKIVLVNRTDLDALGLRYDLGSRNQFFSTLVQRTDSTGRVGSPADPPRVVLGGNTVSAIANASGSVPGAALRLIYSTALGNFDFTTFLDALQEVSLLDVQAEPSVTILNNRTAELVSGSQVPFVPTAGGAGTSLTGPIAVERVQTGVTLRVTPSVTNNRQIMMRVETVNSGATFGPNGVLIDNNSSRSELLVPDGQTVVIGGLTQTTVQLSKSGLPLLVDLPLIGRLFGVTSRTETRRDLLILITPHIIDEGQQSPEAVRR